MIVNLTTRDLRVFRGRNMATIDQSTIVARVEHTERLIGFVEVDELRLPVTLLGPPVTVNLPPPEEGVTYIVNRMVAEVNAHRHDLLFPGPTIRGDGAVVVGCRGFQTLSSDWKSLTQ